MAKVLVVVDMQKDFVVGSLGTSEAKGIVENVETKIKEYLLRKDNVIFTRDTHFEDYLETTEGTNLPVPHCIHGTEGWEIIDEIKQYAEYGQVINKFSFGYNNWKYVTRIMVADEIELIGLCTDICVISNALILKAIVPEVKITVDASCCAGVTPESHKRALDAMKQCQINIINE